MSTISNISSNYLQSVLKTALQDAGLTTQKTRNNPSSTGISSVAAQPDSGQISPFAQLMSTLQNLQQSDPAKYQQVTQQIATNLQDAAKTAQANGNAAAADQLNQLATDFATASKSDQLPNIQDLAKAIGGHHHHHHAHSAPADPDANSNASSNAIGTLLQAQSDSQNPMNIILNTLSNAGIGG